MNTTTFGHFRENTTVKVTRDGDGPTGVIFSEPDGQIGLFFNDGNCGPTLLIALHALITRELIDRGYRSEVDNNVEAAMKRTFQVEATA